MTVTSVIKDIQAHTLTLTAEFAAPPPKVWRLWADPRLLERWWGPPTYPASVVEHDLSPGGRVTYYMTGPDGEQPHGWWRVITVEPPRRLEFEDGFADATGHPDAAMPTSIGVVTIEPIDGGGTRMTLLSRFPSAEILQQMVAMGMEEGITGAVGQMDALLREQEVA